MGAMIRMAFRNVRRNKLRTVLALLCVFAAVFTNVAMGGLMNGMMSSLVRNYTRTQCGHLRVVSADFAEREDFLPLDEFVENRDQVLRALESDPFLAKRVKTVAERVGFGVLLSNGNATKAALALAGDPVKEESLLMLGKSVLPGGSYPDAPGEALMGERLAKALGLSPGDEVKVVAQKTDSGIRMKKFRLSGIVRTGLLSVDDGLLFLPLADAKSLLRMGDASQQILVMLGDHRDADAAAAAARKALAAAGLAEGVAVQSWTEVGDYAQLTGMVSKVYGIFYVGLSLLGAFIITNIMTMVILERKREIGVLKAMGFKGREILSLFVAEGASIGFLGSALGLAAGLAYHAAIVAKGGYDFSSMLANLAYPMDSVVIPEVSAASAALIFVIGVAVAALMSLSPARRAARMNAIDAIKSA